MNIISYRGPGMAGGLSSALGLAWEQHATDGDCWWHIAKSNLQALNTGVRKTMPGIVVDQDLIDGHYHYCNEFLWPVMHDLSQFATYELNHHKQYDQFNQAIASHIRKVMPFQNTDTCFVQDYQLALLPQLLSHRAVVNSAVFWHIPWPRKVDDAHVAPVCAIANGLLSAKVIGFHIAEYANNFMNFVELHLPQFHCDRQKLVIAPVKTKTLRDGFNRKLLVSPLGLDSAYWSSLAEAEHGTVWQRFLAKTPFVL